MAQETLQPLPKYGMYLISERNRKDTGTYYLLLGVIYERK
jgi:hypothetical protein